MWDPPCKMATRQKSHFLSVLTLWLLMITNGMFGQNQAPKGAFASSQREYLEFMNDTTAVTTLISGLGGSGGNDTTGCLFGANMLYLKREYWTGPGRERHWVDWLDFRVLPWKTDTIRLLNRFRGAIAKPADWQDTLLFQRVAGSGPAGGASHR